MLIEVWGLCLLISALMNSNIEWALITGVSASGCDLDAGRPGLTAQDGLAKRPSPT